MGEIQIPFMGRHIGALHHEAHVTEGACIHDFLEILAIEMLHILMLAFIDHIEKRGETVAQIEATAAAMTNIENPAQLCVQRFLVLETFILPRVRLAAMSLTATILPSFLFLFFFPSC